MKIPICISLTCLTVVSCEKKSAPAIEDADQSRRQEAAHRFDEQHDATMKQATQGSIPDPKPAKPLR